MLNKVTIYQNIHNSNIRRHYAYIGRIKRIYFVKLIVRNAIISLAIKRTIKTSV